jgi:hypothetical protein
MLFHRNWSANMVYCLEDLSKISIGSQKRVPHLCRADRGPRGQVFVRGVVIATKVGYFVFIASYSLFEPRLATILAPQPPALSAFLGKHLPNNDRLRNPVLRQKLLQPRPVGKQSLDVAICQRPLLHRRPP